MNKKIASRLVRIGLLLVIFTVIIKLLPKIDSNHKESEKGIESEYHQEETPEEIAFERAIEEEFVPPPFNFKNYLEGDAFVNYESWYANAEKSRFLFSKSKDFEAYSKQAKNNMEILPQGIHYYANRTLSGVWDQKYIHMFSTTGTGPYYTEGGARTDGSLYDPVNDQIYIVSFTGHIYKIDEDAQVKWSLRNHSKRFKGNKFNGVNLPDGSFRMLNQNDTGPMEYSDDEGRTWIDANGAFFEGGANYFTVVTKKGADKRIIAHGARRNSSQGNAWYDYVYISTDYGQNYTTSELSFQSDMFDVEILKPHGSTAVYLFVRRVSDSKLFIYRMTENDNDFVLIQEPTNPITKLVSVNGTTVDGVTHFYMSYDNTTIFYSADEGATWTQRAMPNTSRNITDVHPTLPNVIFKGFVDLNISTDYGKTWTAAKHRLGNDIYMWDLQHFKTYEKENGSFLAISGYDFGTYYSTTPEVLNSWVSVSRGNPTIMCYDAETSEKYDKIFTANQDRGSQSFSGKNNYDKSIPLSAQREANTDILRVTIANGGESVWFWYYYGNIGRASVTNGGDYAAVKSKNYYSNFAATHLVPSPNEAEDAVYVPWGDQLHKITYTGNDVERTFHPFKFDEGTRAFGYSKLNQNRWYVGLKSGQLMYSTDGGNSFSRSSFAGTWPQEESGWRKRRQVIATSPVDEATVYYAGKGNNFLISVDGGKTFTNHNSGLDVDYVSEIDTSPNGQYIFAACELDGAWVYSVQQDRWFKMEGPDVPDVTWYTDVQFIEAENAVRFATYGSGIVDFILDQDFSEIFVAPDNFTIETINETCQGKNGQIKINTRYRHNYVVTIDGIEYNFNNVLNIPTLKPGVYDVCIGIKNTSYNYCVNLEVGASELLKGKFTLTKTGKVAIDIQSGSAPYKVFKNNRQIFETHQTSFEVDATDGDIINIEARATCEGKLTKVINPTGGLVAFPNPVTDKFELLVPEINQTKVTLELYSSTSGLIAQKIYSVNAGKITVNMEEYPAGIYFVRLDSKNPKILKIVKN